MIKSLYSINRSPNYTAFRNDFINLLSSITLDTTACSVQYNGYYCWCFISSSMQFDETSTDFVTHMSKTAFMTYAYYSPLFDCLQNRQSRRTGKTKTRAI